MEEVRPNSDELLSSALAQESREKRRCLQLFFKHDGGLGKIYAMLRKHNYIVSIFWVLATSYINYFLVSFIGYRAVGFLFLFLIVILSVFSSLSSLLLAATLSALIWNFFFIPPQGTFSIHAPEDIMMFFTYFIIALSSGFLTFQIKRHQNILKDREQKTRALYEILKSMTLVRETKELVELALSKIESLFNAKCCVLLASNDKLAKYPDFGNLEVGENDYEVALWSYDHGKTAGWTTDTFPLTRVFCVALKSGDERLGALVFKPHVYKKLNPDQEDLLISIANQIGVALAKQKQEDTIQQSHLIRESEKLHRTLLNCISHELRTPLAAIMGAATALQSQMKNEVSNSSPLRMLTEEIVGSSERLNHVFENLLDVTRLEAGAMPLKREWFDLLELTQFILNRQSKQLSNHKIKLDFTNEPLYFFGDFHLLEHAFANLLLNAANYSPQQSVISVTAKIQAEEIVIEVSDHGAGIPETLIPRLFEKFYRLPGTPAGGLGLGLLVTKNLIELHEGQINVRNNPKGGATFAMILPYVEMPRWIRESLL